MENNSYIGDPRKMTMKELDYLCQGMGPVCVKCNEKIPVGSGICPNVSDIDLVHDLAVKLHLNDRRWKHE